MSKGDRNAKGKEGESLVVKNSSSASVASASSANIDGASADSSARDEESAYNNGSRGGSDQEDVKPRSLIHKGNHCVAPVPDRHSRVGLTSGFSLTLGGVYAHSVCVNFFCVSGFMFPAVSRP